MLGLRFCARAFYSCGKRGPLFIAVRGPLTIAASLVAEHKLQMRRLSSCGSRAQLLRSMWDLPRPGLEPVSPALAGRFSTTAPPGKPPYWIFVSAHFNVWELLLLLFSKYLLSTTSCSYFMNAMSYLTASINGKYFLKFSSPCCFSSFWFSVLVSVSHLLYVTPLGNLPSPTLEIYSSERVT